MRLLNQCIDHRLGVFAFDPHEHHVARVTFDQGGDLAVVAAEQEITFPVTGHSTILGLSRSLADTDRIGDAAMTGALLRVMT